MILSFPYPPVHHIGLLFNKIFNQESLDVPLPFQFLNSLYPIIVYSSVSFPPLLTCTQEVHKVSNSHLPDFSYLPIKVSHSDDDHLVQMFLSNSFGPEGLYLAFSSISKQFLKGFMKIDHIKKFNCPCAMFYKRTD